MPGAAQLTPALCRLEQSLRDYLMTTSHDLRTPCHGVQTASALLTGLGCIQSDGDAMALLKSIEGCCTVLDKLINNGAYPAAAAASTANAAVSPRLLPSLTPLGQC